MNEIIFRSTAVTVDLNQVWKGLLSLAAVAVIVALALLILKIMGTVKRINHLVDLLTPTIKQTVDQLPQTVGHLNAISGNLEDLSSEVSNRIPALLSDVEDVSGIAVDLVDGVAAVVIDITTLFTSFLSFVQKPLQKGSQFTKLIKGAGQTVSVLKRFKTKKK